jgi:hypothetical protein
MNADQHELSGFDVGIWHPFGPHGLESPEQIVMRKRHGIAANGWTVWSFQYRRPQVMELSRQRAQDFGRWSENGVGRSRARAACCGTSNRSATPSASTASRRHCSDGSARLSRCTPFDLWTDTPVQQMARVGVDEVDAEYRCACLLADAVGIHLDDG